MTTLRDMFHKAETGAQAAHACKLEADAVKLAERHGVLVTGNTEIHLDDQGNLASIELGQDDDGMARVILNFAL